MSFDVVVHPVTPRVDGWLINYEYYMWIYSTEWSMTQSQSKHIYEGLCDDQVVPW